MTRGRAVRCLYLDHTAQLSGGEIALARLIEGLGDAVQAEVWLAEDGDLRPVLEDLGVAVRVVPLDRDVVTTSRAASGVRDLWGSLTGAVKMLRYACRLAGLMRAHQFDVVHCNSLKSGLYGSVAGRLAGVPVIWHVRDRIAGDYMPTSVAAVLRRIIAVLPNRVLTNSTATRETLATANNGKVTVLPDMYRVSELRRPSAPPATSPSPFRFALVGRISPWKGQLVALRAFEALELPEGAAELHFIGAPMFDEKAYAADLDAAVELSPKRSSVHLHGFAQDVPGLLTGMHCLVHASTIPEPFGQVVLEGLALGLPVIASGAGGVVEIVEDGVSGLLTPVGDAPALTAAMSDVMSDPGLRAALRHAGLARAQDFTPAVLAPRYTDYYERILADGTPIRR